MKQRFYLDYNATAPLRPAVRAAMLEALDPYGNPSSIHAEGRRARTIVESARKHLADYLGRPSERIVFVASATEGLALALSPFWREPGKDRAGEEILLLGPTEHPAVHDNHGFKTVIPLTVDGDGRLDLEALRTQLRQAPAGVTIAVQAANSETGVLQDIPAIAALAHDFGARLVCDAVQALGRMDPKFYADADFLAFSAHKIGGPKGVGALALARETLHNPYPLLRGGGQERGLRAGTENVCAIAGFGAAVAQIRAHGAAESDRMRRWRDDFERDLASLPGYFQIFGKNAPRLSNTSAFAFAGTKAENLLIGLDLAGVACSSGSACSSGKVRRSRVLEAMKVDPNLANGALRVSFGWSSSDGDGPAAISALRTFLKRLQ